jgi:hypothetical protein
MDSDSDSGSEKIDMISDKDDSENNSNVTDDAENLSILNSISAMSNSANSELSKSLNESEKEDEKKEDEDEEEDEEQQEVMSLHSIKSGMEADEEEKEEITYEEVKKIMDSIKKTPNLIDKDEKTLEELKQMVEDSKRMIEEGKKNQENFELVYRVNDVTQDFKVIDGKMELPKSYLMRYKLDLGRDFDEDNDDNLTEEQIKKLNEFELGSEEGMKEFKKYVQEEFPVKTKDEFDLLIYVQGISMSYDGRYVYFNQPNSNELKVFDSHKTDKLLEEMQENPYIAGIIFFFKI